MKLIWKSSIWITYIRSFLKKGYTVIIYQSVGHFILLQVDHQNSAYRDNILLGFYRSCFSINLLQLSLVLNKNKMYEKRYKEFYKWSIATTFRWNFWKYYSVYWFIALLVKYKGLSQWGFSTRICIKSLLSTSLRKFPGFSSKQCIHFH